MLELPNITLVAMSSVRIEETIQAFLYSMKDIKFGAVRFITHERPSNLPENIEYCNIEKINNIDEWNYAIIYKLTQYIDTDYCLLIHDDGFVVNPDCWRDEFLDYDYIGAPWPLPNDNFSYRDINNNLIRVGNSVSLRSKKLIDVPNKLNLEWKPFHGYYNEDGYICVNYRHKYLQEGCKFADIDVAKYFSHETMIEETKGIKPFMFHRYAGTNSQYPKYRK